METKRISELPSNDEILNGNELLEVATMPSTGTQTVASKKSLLSEIGKWIFGRLHNSRLQTQNKTIIGAINEIKNAETGESGSGAAHNAVYRGKCLGPAPTAEQYEAIRNNTFDDMYVGDYWYDENEGIHWRIAGFNYYHGVGNNNWSSPTKITNYHIVIVPDEPIIGDTFINEQGELRQTQIIDTAFNQDIYHIAARGYKTMTYYTSISEEPPGPGVRGTVTLLIPHKPETFTIVATPNVSTIPSNNGGGFLPESPCLVSISRPDEITVSEDSLRPGTWKIEFPCYYRDYGQRLQNDYLSISRISNDPLYDLDNLQSVSLPNLPKFTNICITYTYYEEGYGALEEAEKIIINKFGENHIMPFPFGKYHSDSQFPYSYRNLNSVTTKVDLLSTEQLTGNGSMSCIGENHYPEFIRYCFSTSTHGGATKPTDEYFKNYAIIAGEEGYWTWYQKTYSRWVLNRLPLFTFNPSLIHTGYNYWLSSIYSYSGENIYGNANTITPVHLINYVIIDESGIQTVANAVIGQCPGTGIRPYFLLSYTSSPNSNG